MGKEENSCVTDSIYARDSNCIFLLLRYTTLDLGLNSSSPLNLDSKKKDVLRVRSQNEGEFVYLKGKQRMIWYDYCFSDGWAGWRIKTATSSTTMLQSSVNYSLFTFGLLVPQRQKPMLMRHISKEKRQYLLASNQR